MDDKDGIELCLPVPNSSEQVTIQLDKEGTLDLFHFLKSHLVSRGIIK